MKARSIFLLVLIVVLWVILAASPVMAQPVFKADTPEPAPIQVTTEWLLAALSFVMALLFGYVPKLKTWYSSNSSEVQALIMAAVLLVICVVVFALNCLSVMVLSVACTVQGGVQLFYLWLLCLAVNQGTYTMLVKPFKK